MVEVKYVSIIESKHDASCVEEVEYVSMVDEEQDVKQCGGSQICEHDKRKSMC